eukprot:15065974-Alexandrium_andersonii.AAC.1
MKCRVCNSEEHFARDCPQGKGSGKGGGPPPSFPVMTPVVGTRGGQATDFGAVRWSGFVGDDGPGPLGTVFEQFPNQVQETQRFMVAPGEGTDDEVPAAGTAVPPPPDPYRDP